MLTVQRDNCEYFFAGIQAGGSRFTCAIADVNGVITDKIVIPTTTPDETLMQVVKYIKSITISKPIKAIGIASFGPIDLDRDSPTYGYITTAAKPGWVDFDFVGTIRQNFSIPIGFDTDANCAALGEYNWGVARNLDNFMYFLVGTGGIGAGAVISGKPLHGLLHPEMGHMFIPYDSIKDKFAGVCPYHGNCLEGLASGNAIKQRWGVRGVMDLPPQHSGWDLEAEYLAKALANCTLILSPRLIIIGGSVMRRKELLPKIRKKLKLVLNGYVKHDCFNVDMDKYLVEPSLQDESGIYGALALAEESYRQSEQLS